MPGFYWANADEEDDAYLDEGRGIGWGNLNCQEGGLFRDALTWEEGAGAMPVARCNASAMVFGGE